MHCMEAIKAHLGMWAVLDFMGFLAGTCCHSNKLKKISSLPPVSMYWWRVTFDFGFWIYLPNSHTAPSKHISPERTLSSTK